VRPPLPIDPYLEQIAAALSESPGLVLMATPGAGKTTRVPPALIASGFLKSPHSRVLMLQPRRLAARAAAQRMAVENSWELGDEVGYQVRFESRVSNETKIIVVTEGLLSRKLISDPELNGIGCVILDEFHERSWHTDLGLGLLRELQLLSRPDLKILVMSATLNPDGIASYLGNVPIINVTGQNYPLELHYQKQPMLLNTGPEFIKRVETSIRDVLTLKSPTAGDVLVFLPGAGEIRQVARRFEGANQLNGIETHSLHSNLNLEAQAHVLNPARDGRRKLILATNIAESSLTIDGVATVIDSGLARSSAADAQGFSHLDLTRISRFSARQRAGRAHRQQAGHCYRLWSKLDEASMVESDRPELMRIDLSEAILFLVAQGISDLKKFTWFEPPDPLQLDLAAQRLQRLKAIELQQGQVKLTDFGRRLLDWPLHPRLGLMMEIACDQQDPDFLHDAAWVCAVVSERDFVREPRQLKNLSNIESDPILRKEIACGHLHAADILIPAQLKRIVRQLEAMAKARMAHVKMKATSDRTKLVSSGEDRQAELLMLGFADRLARRRRPNRPEAKMAGGRGIMISENCTVEQAEFLVVIDSRNRRQEGRSISEIEASSASRVEISWIRAHFSDELKTESQPIFNADSKKFFEQTQTCLWGLPIDEPTLKEPDSSARKTLLGEYLRQNWKELWPQNDSARSWFARALFAQWAEPQRGWPQITDSTIQPAIDSLIESLSEGESTLDALLSKDWKWALNELLDTNLRLRFDTEVPEHIRVPSGHMHRIHYQAGQNPWIEVRIQEIFGWRQSPVILNHKLVLHLLAPNFRPVQVTSDLESFWRNSYGEIKSQLRIRYPKHSWPDDPLTATPQAKGRGAPRRS